MLRLCYDLPVLSVYVIGSVVRAGDGCQILYPQPWEVYGAYAQCRGNLPKDSSHFDASKRRTSGVSLGLLCFPGRKMRVIQRRLRRRSVTAPPGHLRVAERLPAKYGTTLGEPRS